MLKRTPISYNKEASFRHPFVNRATSLMSLLGVVVLILKVNRYLHFSYSSLLIAGCYCR